MKTFVGVLTVVAALSAAQAAMAEEQWCTPGGTVTADAAKVMLEKQGYDVKVMGEEHGCLEAKALSPKGERVEVYIDSHDGKIVRIKE
jgi:hypothetical protein